MYSHDEEAFASQDLLACEEVELTEAIDLSDGAEQGHSLAQDKAALSADKAAEGAQDPDVRQFEGYCAPAWKAAAFWALVVLSGGTLLLATRWFSRLQVALRLQRCALAAASHVLVTLADGQQEVVAVQLTDAEPGGAGAHHLVASATAAPLPAPAPRQTGLGGKARQQRLLEYRCARHLYSAARGTFLLPPPMPPSLPAALRAHAAAAAASQPDLARLAEPESSREALRLWYGANDMTVPVKSVAQLLTDEMFHPFYVFQYASVVIWCIELYYVYALVILAITAFSILTNALNAHSTRKRLSQLARFTCRVTVRRNGTDVAVDSTQLVPGDLVWVGPGQLPADLVLLRGEAIVDEAMLTGEAVPVRKTAFVPPPDGAPYDPDHHKASTLFGGTTVAQARAGAAGEAGPLAMVCRTRFGTAKGQLLKSMLFPHRLKQHFATDAVKFIVMMLLVGAALYLWGVVALARQGEQVGNVFLRFLDLITVAVPPALPASLAVAVAIAVARLRRHEIFVSSPDRISAAGQLDVLCFDKTGTLTTSGLDLKGVAAMEGGRLGALSDDPARCPAGLTALLASCHGLAALPGGGGLVGDPLDQRLLAWTRWRLREPEPHAPGPAGPGGAQAHVQVHPPDEPGMGYDIIRRFEFSSETARNVVVVRPRAAPGRAARGLLVAAKGAPEVLQRLVTPASLPPNFNAAVAEYAREGLRVIALAGRELGPEVSAEEAAAMSQAALEAGLAFAGFAVMVNPLRSDSADVISQLQAAQLRTVMVTGDHARTAISVAHQAGMLAPARSVALVDCAQGEDEAHSALALVLMAGGGAQRALDLPDLLRGVAQGDMECAVTGRGFAAALASRQAELLPLLLQRAAVWARMAPDQKRQLVELLGQGGAPGGAGAAPVAGLGHSVAFCGDGANDVGALKAAHVGVSLCEAEASVAAPLTARQQSIACMVTVVAEGRASLTTSFLIFKYIIVYAFVQVIAVNLMYSYGLRVGNYQYLVQDLLYTTVLAGLMGLTGPARALTPARPVARLITPAVMAPVAAQLLLVLAFQLLALAVLHRDPGYHTYHNTTGKAFSQSEAPENSAVFLACLAQFLIAALVFNRGPPHRLPLWTNRWLVGVMAAQTAFLGYLLFSPGDALTRHFAGLVPLPPGTRAALFFLILANLVLAYLVELGVRLAVEKGVFAWLGAHRRQRAFERLS